MKNKKYFKAAVSLGVGAILLTSAVFANYENAGGYSVCKNALKKVAFAENFSMDYTGNISIDSESCAKIYGSYKLNVDGNPSAQTESTEVSGNYTYFSRRTLQDDIHIQEFNDGNNPDNPGYIHDRNSKAQSLASGITNDPETGEKLINFVETLSDTLIGDLKNSFVLTSDEGGVKKYDVTLSKEQLPSYVTSGVSLLTSAIRNENSASSVSAEEALANGDPTPMFFGSGEPYVRVVSANMSVDDKGNPVQVTATVNIIGYDINGTEHVMSVNISIDFYDFGTTEIERVSDEEMRKLNDYRSKTIQPKDVEIKTEAAAEVTNNQITAEINDGDGPTAVYID